ncbi:MAG: relaxase/mobilization nuclease domain-containing protein [Oscillospiraceae bacterium]|nr:relaxase/mobilization nuclease domain-containing protein [Oscillospiraceae bacterium]
MHYIQSFYPKDNISPELAHQIARTFARKAFGDNCQVVIATHVDKQHVHSHIIINAYGIDGRKFNDNQTTLKQIREHSDRVCLAFGIKPIDTERGANRNIASEEWNTLFRIQTIQTDSGVRRKVKPTSLWQILLFWSHLLTTQIKP